MFATLDELGRARARSATDWLPSQLGYDPTTELTSITAQITGQQFARMDQRGMIGIVYGGLWGQCAPGRGGCSR